MTSNSKQKSVVVLSGGDRRSIGRANEIVLRVLRRPGEFDELVECLRSHNSIVRMRAADAIEKISLQKPEILRAYRAELLDLLEEAEQQELRWHLAQIVPRLALTKADLERAFASVRDYLDDRSSIVKTCALQALTDLSQRDETLCPLVRKLLHEAERTGTAAMKARARKLLAKMEE
jgi:hypothetical protein